MGAIYYLSICVLSWSWCDRNCNRNSTCPFACSFVWFGFSAELNGDQIACILALVLVSPAASKWLAKDPIKSHLETQKEKATRFELTTQLGSLSLPHSLRANAFARSLGHLEKMIKRPNSGQESIPAEGPPTRPAGGCGREIGPSVANTTHWHPGAQSKASRKREFHFALHDH